MPEVAQATIRETSRSSLFMGASSRPGPAQGRWVRRGHGTHRMPLLATACGSITMTLRRLPGQANTAPGRGRPLALPPQCHESPQVRGCR